MKNISKHVIEQTKKLNVQLNYFNTNFVLQLYAEPNITYF